MSTVPIMTSVRNSKVAGSLTGAVVALATAISSASDPWLELSPRPADMIGTLSCTSASCHGSPQQRGMAGTASRQVYVHWLGGEPKYQAGRRGYDPRSQIEKASGDPHAHAALRMQAPRFQEVLRRYGQRADGSLDERLVERCAKCHDPTARKDADHRLLSTQHPVLSTQPSDLGPHASVSTSHTPRERGIGCESCHGAAKNWVTVHYEREITRERLLELGMVDTKNLFIRARLCASCHVGSADNDMNHDMIAAGHPPLRFELASYEALLEHKHWDDRPRRLADPDYEVQLWTAGRVAAAEAALALLEGRTRRAEASADAHSGAAWPEFAEGNCLSCHQPLRAELGKLQLTLLFGNTRGVPPWQTWNVALVSAASGPQTIGAVDSPAPGSAVAEALGRLRSAMGRSLAPEASEIAELAAAARKAVRAATSGELRVDAKFALEGLAASQGTEGWEQACQELVALAAVERSLRDRGAINDAGQAQTRDRRARIAAALCFKTSDREWPRAYLADHGMSLADVFRELAVLRAELEILTAGEATR
jgi:mono/diheme cytochrome c family protein